ncbi:phthiocerol/phthiodiolone dimycocerosyl transferase family protein [Nocardia asteroides]|uniref:phthiocerol/phthiodiolone dimycocerosyl transferase family protein n=1 Tax=Nocardia asteroides TaxID=1824 RepID=UPI001E3E9913|nr:acyltransferase [Nocardia asteroides]UGT60531.1 acyltransferase [Nocardia asteroides]
MSGALDIGVLRRAFADLQASYPILRCRIAADPALLLAPRGRAPRLWLATGDPAVVPLPRRALRPDRALGYLDVVRDRGLARVTLYVHHAVADAGHCLALFARLWELYTERAEYGRATVREHPLPLPLEQHVLGSGLSRAGVSGLENVIAAGPPPPPPTGHAPGPQALARPHRLVLDPAATARLTGFARAHGVSMNGVVTAALLRAFAELAPARGPVGCVYPVDLRTRLGHQVDAVGGTNMAGLTGFLATGLDRAADPVELAQRVNSTLRHDLAEGIVQQSVLHFPDFYGDRRVHSLAGHVAITNTGAVRPFTVPAGLRLTDYEIVYLSAHPRPSAGASAAVTFLVYTYAGRLSVGVLGGGDPERMAAAVRAELDLLVEGVPVAG